ncbi:MAG: sugar phosphate isomerase/epimerase [bacterium]|nr:sugar phosphate isomerase/epimerase [bacterium]
MKLGFLTVCLGKMELPKLVQWSSENGFQALEVAAWPVDSDRDYAGSTLNVTTLTAAKAKEIKKLFSDHNMEISSLAYYDNNLHPDPKKRKAIHQHLYKVINAAELLEVELVGTFIGRDPNLTIEDNFKEFKKIFKEHLVYAKKHNVKLMIENCPMEGWQKPELVGNIAFSPDNWKKMFELRPEENFGLNLDPSHLYWLGVDYIEATKEFASRIFHTHAKDTEILSKKLSTGSIYSRGWWRYRMPGLGEINWGKWISVLSESGYDGVISIEHEDPVWEHSEEKVKKGLFIAKRHLTQFLV